MAEIINVDFKSNNEPKIGYREYWNFLLSVRTDAEQENFSDAWAVYEIRIVQDEDELRLIGVFEDEMSADRKIKDLQRVHRGLIEEIHSIGPKEVERYGRTVDLWFSEEKRVFFGYLAYKVKTRLVRYKKWP